MQAYFDRDDAELEHECIVARALAHTDSDPEGRFAAFGRRGFVNLTAVLVGLGLFSLLLVSYLGSVELAQTLPTDELNPAETKFIFEIPEPEIPKPQVKPKPKPEPKPEEPRPVERLRSVPDSRVQDIRPQERLKNRAEKDDSQREAQKETAIARSAPAVRMPAMPAMDNVEQRNYGSETARRSSVGELTERREEVVRSAGNTEQRTLAEGGLSRVKLDPYHYQMVNVCLRLCVRTMFTHAGIDEQEKRSSSDWLRISRGGSEYFEYRYGGRWVRFAVNAGALGNISNLDFVSMPGQWAGSDEAESLLEDVTRKLCALLGYDDCLKKL